MNETIEQLRSRVTARLLTEGRWSAAAAVRDELMREARRSGKTSEEVKVWAYSELDRLFPPQLSEGQGGDANLPARSNATSVESPARAQDAAVTGLDAIPEHWPALAPNAPLGVEIQWVQANRLSVVRDLGDRAVVDLGKAMSPAPSWAALGWLETSIRVYAKFVDVAAKASATLEDQREMVKREKLAVEEVRGLLAEMLAE